MVSPPNLPFPLLGAMGRGDKAGAFDDLKRSLFENCRYVTLLNAFPRSLLAGELG